MKKGDIAMNTIAMVILALIVVFIISAIFYSKAKQGGDSAGTLIKGVGTDFDNDSTRDVLDPCPCDPQDKKNENGGCVCPCKEPKQLCS